MVEITGINFTDEYTGAGATKNPFLMGSMGDALIAYVDVSVHWESLKIICIFVSTAKTIERRDNRSFIKAGFSKGDTFTIVGSASNAGNYTIASISADGSTITTVEALVDETASGVSFYGTTPILAVDFYSNLIENSAPLSFISLVDNQTQQKLSGGKAAWVAGETVNLLQATTSIGWLTGATGTVIKNTIANNASGYKQTFTITKSFAITPYVLSGQVTRLNGKLVYPPYFLDTLSLKYVAKVNARYDTINPIIPHTTDPNYVYPLGNVGWFNEFLNGGVADYTLTSVAYTDVATSLPVTQIDLARDTQVVAVLNSAAGNFLGGGIGVGSFVALNFFYCPNDQTDYVNTTTNQNTNFRLDRKLLTVGAASVNGNGFGTDTQAIKSITAVFNNANQVTVTFTVSLSAYNKSFLQGKVSTNRNYILMATPQKRASTKLADTDRNSVLIDNNSFIWNQDDATLLTFSDTNFFQYPDTTTNAYTDYKGMIGDHVLSRSRFTINNGATPIDFTTQIVAVNSVTGESFDLEKYTQTFPSDDTNGQACSDVAPQILNYKLPSSDPRNQAYLNRNVALDTVTDFGWEFYYGFVLRYETWRQVPNFASAFNCGHSQDWSIYGLQPNWSIQHWTTINVSKGGYTTQFQRQANITVLDDAFSDNGYGGVLALQIDTYYADANGFQNAKGLILGDQDTHVKLTITGDLNTLPVGANGYYAYLALDVSGIGGELFRDVATSEEQPLVNSGWKQSVLVTAVSSQGVTHIDIECDIDFTKLDLQNKQYLITGRLGYKY